MGVFYYPAIEFSDKVTTKGYSKTNKNLTVSDMQKHKEKGGQLKWLKLISFYIFEWIFLKDKSPIASPSLDIFLWDQMVKSPTKNNRKIGSF